MISLISYYADLAIGLVLAFLLLSLLVSGLNEGIVRLLGIRSKFLWAYLRDTLDGAETADKVSAPLKALDRLLGMLKGLGRRLRNPLVDLLPPPSEGRSRLPATVLGVFAKLPFGKDPRPDFIAQPAPAESPPLAPAPDSVAAEEVTTPVTETDASAAPADGVVPDQAVPDQPVPAQREPVDDVPAERPVETVAMGVATGAAMGTAARTGVTALAGTADQAADPAHGADQADAAEVAEVAEAAAAAAQGDPVEAAAPQIVPAGQGKSMAELLHERLQEIDHTKRGKTSIAEIPPARFAVALLEIATEHGGIEALMRDLDTLKSPLYRPLKAVWDRTNDDLEAFRRGVEEWFDGEMTRLTLLYRRYVRWVLGMLALVVTLLFSMDALEYGKTLLNDNAYRSEVTAFAQSGPEALAPLKAQCEPGQDPYACVTDVLSTPAFVKIFTHAPVSVVMRADASPAWQWHGGDWWSRLASPGHWPGFLATLVALLFGAPFWWDILRRITGIRSRAGGNAK
ncbi:hypothetical protein N5079_07410 [Planotetraspora sp. A-T 1434]|uniref:hypothetical protein n=1 Tax=Planotetraspora sp. A-T 1434 TaxID=2979219 RepID=UPI0021C0F822|nr:hypothetical protein [Planotetraspora sp. A-T 1434]MCT9930048.1 hypothetical protein [Planotetraspora sp. A-T 1434]